MNTRELNKACRQKGKKNVQLKLILFILFLTFSSVNLYSQDREVKDNNYKFSFSLPDLWENKDVKETADKDGISYSFIRKDNKGAIMLMAFKIGSVKNLEDFIYIMEKDVELNIPTRQGDYVVFDKGNFDGKTARYKDNNTIEQIYFVRTKLAEAPYNFAYMLRFISSEQFWDGDMESQVRKIADTFIPNITLD
jgi:hypothetical protein